MNFAPLTDPFKQTARQEFEDLYRIDLVSYAWSTIAGRRNGLLRLEDMKQGKQVSARNDLSIQTVDIDSIAGSEIRVQDFDSRWRPLKRANQERWTNIAVAQMTDVPLPAIDLIKVGQAYFVRNGHHRISVAKHRGQLEIEANVTEWRMKEETVAAEPGATNHRPTVYNGQISTGGSNWRHQANDHDGRLARRIQLALIAPFQPISEAIQQPISRIAVS